VEFSWIVLSIFEWDTIVRDIQMVRSWMPSCSHSSCRGYRQWKVLMDISRLSIENISCRQVNYDGGSVKKHMRSVNKFHSARLRPSPSSRYS
jgi:hypothetical protein